MNLAWQLERDDEAGFAGAVDPFVADAEVGGYRLLEPLGSGGMAEVWRAKSFGPGGFERDVVIKRIQNAHASDPEFVSLFLDEAKISGLLHHPNVVEVYGFGEHRGAPYLVMEHVEGPSVSRVLRALRSTKRRMPPAIAAYVAREVCRALAYVHELGDERGRPLSIVHRDVTPSNVLFTRSGGVKLLDFGVAKFRSSESLTRAGTVRGKPAYLAPEQIEEKAIDRRVDLFSLGVVLHEMLSLEHLFAGDSDLVTVRKVLEMEIPRPSSRCAGVPDALDAIVMKALERDRERRYQSAAEMARDLDEIVVASGLRIEELTAFVTSLEADMHELELRAVSRMRAESARSPIAGGRAPRRGSSASTARGRGRVRAHQPRARGRAGAAVAGVALFAAALAAAFGLHVNIGKNIARAATTPPAIECSSNPG